MKSLGLGLAGTTAIAALAAGLAVIALGIFECAPDAHRWAKLGWILSAIALPAVITTQVRRVTNISAHERAEIDQAGYRRCLDHIARGLLLVADPSGPTPGEPNPTTSTPGVPRLHAVPDQGRDPGERTAL